MEKLREILVNWCASLSARLNQWAEFLEAEELRKKEDELDWLERREKQETIF